MFRMCHWRREVYYSENLFITQAEAVEYNNLEGTAGCYYCCCVLLLLQYHMYAHFFIYNA